MVVLVLIRCEAVILDHVQTRCEAMVRPHVPISSEVETVVIARVGLTALLAGRKPVEWVHRAMQPLKAYISAQVPQRVPL